jgi:hypothetical protein
MFFEALIPISMFVSAAAMIIITTYIDRTAKHKERMALIENGADASIFEKPKKVKGKRNKSNNYSALKFGMLAVGLGLGLVSGALLNIILRAEPLPHFAMMLIGGGSALIAYYNIVAKREAIERDRIEFEKERAEELV